MAIAWDYLTPLQIAQLKACRPELAEETDYRVHCGYYESGRCTGKQGGHPCLIDQGYPCDYWDREAQDEIRARKGE